MAATTAASSLPLRLQNFFARYPPHLYSAKFTGIKIPLTRKDAKEAAIARAAELENQPADSSIRHFRPNILAQQPVLASVRTPSQTDSDSPSESLASSQAA